MYEKTFIKNRNTTLAIQDLYKNSSVFVICNGPSFNKIDNSKLKSTGIVTYGMNNGGHLFRPNIWTCTDNPKQFLGSIWKDPTILKIVPTTIVSEHLRLNGNDSRPVMLNNMPNIVGFRTKVFSDSFLKEGICLSSKEHKVRSTLISVLNICHALGFKTIYLVGCDFDMSDTNKYWFDETRSEKSINRNNESYKNMNAFFNQTRPIFEENGTTIYNLNPYSKLDAFEYKDFGECIEKEKIDLSETTSGKYRDLK